MNNVLKQIGDNLELDTNSFIDVPSSDNKDLTLYIPANETEEKILDFLINKKSFSYKVKKVNVKNIASSLS
jgi:hypothetical protein